MTAPASAGLAPAATIRSFAHRTVLALMAILASLPVFAGSFGQVTPDQWRAHAKVGILDRVTLRIHWHDNIAHLRETAKQHNVSIVDLRGFSILRRKTESGEWVCDVFVVGMRGAFVDKDRTVTFGHEVLHCFGFRHE